MRSERPNQNASGSINLSPAVLLFAGAAIAGACMLGGCKSDKDYYSYNSIKGNLTPELQGLTERQVDIDRNIAVNQNADIRLMWMDLGRVWFTDNPSTLSPYWTISTSGQPY